jgi:DNA polymerase-3 subunit gamma/tau
VFENIINQSAVFQLRDDIVSERMAPSMLFYGPGESGKGSAALEFARVLSCDEKGEWTCSCPSCEKHRYLLHEDLLVLGKKNFSAEISACCNAFLRNPETASAKLLFFRSLRKLQLRFSPVLMEDDPKFGKFSSVLQSLDEGLNEYWGNIKTMEKEAAEKYCSSLLKTAITLDNEGIYNTIPINYIRRASYWCRLAPNGRRKTLIIENAENTRDEARNSLLKLLEEPPSTVNIILTAKRREAIMPTILSRLRPYRFLKRDAESEKEVIRRVFQDKGTCISKYLDLFLTQSTEKLQPLAAWFIVSLSRFTAFSIKKKGIKVPSFINMLDERYAPLTAPLQVQGTGIEKSSSIIKSIVSKSGNFEDESFSRFMNIILDLVYDVTRDANKMQYCVYNDIFRKYINEAVTSVDVLNLNVTIALESLFYNIKTAMIQAAYD